MQDLFSELKSLLLHLEQSGVPYALCGGFALAVHGYVRATEDIDLLTPEVEALATSAASAGFTVRNPPMSLAGGSVLITRLLKPAGSELLWLDLLHVTPATAPAWEERERQETELGAVTVVSRAGLCSLKLLRSSPLDLNDIECLNRLP